MELTIIISFIAGLAIGIAAMLVAYFRQKVQHAEQSQASGTRIQILEAQMQADRKHFEETKALAEENPLTLFCNYSTITIILLQNVFIFQN